LFSNRDIADYYNQTLNHYQRWWQLNRALAVHYGYWNSQTTNLTDALQMLNQVMAEIAEIQNNINVFDAGCGVGGSLFYLAKNYDVNGVGITLSEKQHAFATAQAHKHGFDKKVSFMIGDYVFTTFADETFDLIWAIESITSTSGKRQFAHEAYRLLKHGGKLIVADYYLNGENLYDTNDYLEKWRKTWSMSPFISSSQFISIFENYRFRMKKDIDITQNIFPTSKKMYRASLLGTLPSIAYNLTHNTSRFAKTHYLSGIYQYKALKKGLWQYHIHLFEKS